jgi:hypothetical protein
VWKKGAGGWQWISHANLASIPLEALAVLISSNGRGEKRGKGVKAKRLSAIAVQKLIATILNAYM